MNSPSGTAVATKQSIQSVLLRSAASEFLSQPTKSDTAKRTIDAVSFKNVGLHLRYVVGRKYNIHAIYIYIYK